MQRSLKRYLPILLLLLALGLPTRTIPNLLPGWYVAYAGDFLWAMMVFFLFCLVFRLPTATAFFVALATTYLIEVTQLFHPAWLETLRSYRLFGLVFGYSFLWSDIVAYTLGIGLGAALDYLLTGAARPGTQSAVAGSGET
ncbi:MAG: DUF2809 domain-containing protein [Anaerolineales bacterium]|nr:DUF2809 domain-containing protein [Anaerolineales bacterium]MCB0027402.1 DUF2809 domain-containing protein [Anaerolineales bacterium]